MQDNHPPGAHRAMAGRMAPGRLTFRHAQLAAGFHGIPPAANAREDSDKMIEMKSRAESRIDRLKRMQHRTIEEKTEAQNDRAELVARLRALRLAQEASDEDPKGDEKIADKRDDDAAPSEENQPFYPVPHRR